MGRKSVKTNKSVYQVVREQIGLTREQAADIMPGISPERIEKLENGRINMQPEDIIMLAQCYKAPHLCNYYCANECAIGHEHVEMIQPKPLAQITVETLASLSKLNRAHDRLIEIAEDGKISKDEYADFVAICDTLSKIAASAETLKIWVEEQVANGEIDRDALK